MTLASPAAVEQATALLVVQSERGETGRLEPWTAWACEVAAARFDLAKDPSGDSRPFAEALADVIAEARTGELRARGQTLRARDMNPLLRGSDRGRLQSEVIDPTLAAIEAHVILLDPYHPTFLRNALGDIGLRRTFLHRIGLVKNAGLAGNGQVLAALKLTVANNHRRQRDLILPAARGMSRPSRDSQPHLFWRTKLQGEDRWIGGGPASCALAESWGYDEVARAALKDLAESTFPAEHAAHGLDLFSSLLFVGKPKEVRKERFVGTAVRTGLRGLARHDFDLAEDCLRAVGIRSPESLSPVTTDRLNDSKTPENRERAVALIAELILGDGRSTR